MTHTVHILLESTYSGSTESLVFPIFLNQRRLSEHGVRTVFFKKIAPRLFECDTLFISSRFFASWWPKDEGNSILELLREAREKGSRRIIWYDIGDSTGVNKFKVLPYVDRYVKGQLFRDRRNFQKQYYGMRAATDFYHRQFGIEDAVSDPPHLKLIPTDKELEKLALGWNWGMKNYGYWGDTLGKFAYHFSRVPRFVMGRWIDPSSYRPISISCRIGSSYPRNTVAFPREEIKRRLSKKIPTDFLTRRQFLKEMKIATAGITPFGWGEVCFRDFELTLAGAAMIKQDMDHLETWPDIYRENTYVPFKWDFSDFDEKIEYVMTHPREMAELAQAAQKIYRRVMATEEGYQEFCSRFIRLISLYS